MFENASKGQSYRRLRWLVADLNLDLALLRLRRKYREGQSRDDRGRFAYEGGSSDVGTILAIARRTLAAGGTIAYQRCLDLCYPLLERSKPPGSDRNTFDFHKCMNACLGRK